MVKRFILESAKRPLQQGMGADRVAHGSALHMAEFEHPEPFRRQFRIGHGISLPHEFHPCGQRIDPLLPFGNMGAFAGDFYRHLAGTGHHWPAAGANGPGRQIRPKVDAKNMPDV